MLPYLGTALSLGQRHTGDDWNGAMSDHLDLHAPYQAHAGGLAVGIDVIPWGSAAAQEAVNRVCQEVTARCEQVIATQAATDTPDQDAEISATAGKSPETDDDQP